MKRLYALLAALLLVSFALPAEAAWNIRQRGDGSAVLTDQNSVNVPLSGDTYVVPISSVGSVVTTFVAVHSPGRIRKIYIVGNGTFASASTAPTFTFKATTGANNALNQFRAVSVGATLTMITTTPGVASSVSPADSNNEVTQGSVIAIVAGAVSVSTGVGATITIVIE